MTTICPNCGVELDNLNTKRLKLIMRNMTLVNKLSDYILKSTPENEWHPEVKEFAYKNLIITSRNDV